MTHLHSSFDKCLSTTAEKAQSIVRESGRSDVCCRIVSFLFFSSTDSPTSWHSAKPMAGAASYAGSTNSPTATCDATCNAISPTDAMPSSFWCPMNQHARPSGVCCGASSRATSGPASALLHMTPVDARWERRPEISPPQRFQTWSRTTATPPKTNKQHGREKESNTL
jgi:hypothetical protein